MELSSINKQNLSAELKFSQVSRQLRRQWRIILGFVQKGIRFALTNSPIVQFTSDACRHLIVCSDFMNYQRGRASLLFSCLESAFKQDKCAIHSIIQYVGYPIRNKLYTSFNTKRLLSNVMTAMKVLFEKQTSWQSKPFIISLCVYWKSVYTFSFNISSIILY